MLYIVQLSGKILFGFVCHILRKKKEEFFPSANCEHLNGIVLEFARGMPAGGKEQPWFHLANYEFCAILRPLLKTELINDTVLWNGLHGFATSPCT